MVFSQTSLKTQTVLKVVKLDHLKNEKNHQVNGSTGVVNRIDGYSNAAQSSPVATTSYTEVSLKTEPLYDSTMFHESDFEFFQELDPLCCNPAKEEVVQTIDSFKKTEEKALNIDTPHIPFSPQEWEQFDVNSPLPPTGFYNITPVGSVSPIEKYGQCDNSVMFNFPEGDKDNSLQNQEKFLDSLPLVIGDLTSDPVTDMTSWQTAAEPVEWATTADTHYDLIYTNTPNTAPFINADDSLDLKFGSVTPGEVEVINLVGSEFMLNKEQDFGAMQTSIPPRRNEGLSVDITARAPAWPGEISTPIILNDVISLEKEKCTEILDPPEPWLPQNTPAETYTTLKTSPKLDYEPITPKSESHVDSDNDDSKSKTSKRKLHDSEDSDETYTPYSEQPPRKYKTRKRVPIKELMLALESQPKARRGRPPKRRESTVSSVCSVDENSSSTSTQEFKYRELRDKNNEASKRSRMNRKLKEQQMELLAVELEEKNKKLRVEADILEEMTKKLKSELMSAILSR